MQFRKKPVVIEAITVREALRFANTWKDGEPWLIDAYDNREIVFTPDAVHISTLENASGEMVIGGIDDWIIRGVQGELYPCKPDIFEQTYEAVE